MSSEMSYKRKYDEHVRGGYEKSSMNSNITPTGSSNEAKNTNQRSPIDPVDEAILNLAELSKHRLLQRYTADELFFLSISAESQQLDRLERLKFKKEVMEILISMLDSTA